MADPFAETGAITGYHAHIYYDPRVTRDTAARLRERVGAAFPSVRIGSWHDEPVGPHGVAMYQVVFETGEFSCLVPWLMLHRDGLNVLVHPQTGDPYADHTVHALWVGVPQPLRLGILRRARDSNS